MENGFWEYLSKTRDINVDLTTKEMCFKKKGTMYQILDLLSGNDLFCVRYELEEGKLY